MRVPVSDKASSPDDNIATVVKAIGTSAVRRGIFRCVYTGKKAIKMVDEIAKALKISPKHVLTEGRRLAIRGAFEPIRDNNKTGYKKDDFYESHKAEIYRRLDLKEFKSQPTKARPHVTIAGATLKVPNFFKPRIKEITVDDIDSFKKVRAISAANSKPLSESRFKRGIARIVSEGGRFKDWGGEQNDLNTTRLRFNGRRRGAVFAFKGPATTGILVPAKMGKNGDQIQRLFGSHGEIFFVQYWGQIAESIRQLMSTFARVKSIHDSGPVFYCVIDRRDSARLVQAYPRQFK
jgi:hypothetical protein